MGSKFGIKSRHLSTLLVFVALLWAILRVGLGKIPGLEGAATNAFGWPSVSLGEYSSFAATSPTGALVYTVIGQDNYRIFLLIHIIAVTLAIALTILWVRSMSDASMRDRAVRLSILSPWIAILLIFIGSYDPFTIIGFALLLWSWRSKRWYWPLAVGIYVGFQHFEQGLLGISAAALVLVAVRDRLDQRFASSIQIAASFAGVLTGKLLLTSILILGSETTAFGRSSYWTLEWIRISVVTSINFGAVFILSLFAGLWALAIYVFSSLSGRSRYFLVAAFLVCFIPAFMSLDHTRVFVMVSFMSLSLLIISVSQSAFQLPSRIGVVIEGMAWLVVPISVWVGMDGTPYLSPVGSLDQLIIFVNDTFR